MPQNEIHSAISVLNDKGAPQNFGWARQPHFFYDPALMWAPRRRNSGSDRYIVFNATHTVIFEIRNDGYLGHLGITVISMRERKHSTHVFQALLPLGSFKMPSGSHSGAIRYRRKKLILDFVPMESQARIIKADIPKFGHNHSLRGELVLTEPAFAESLVCNVPWRNDKKAFRYSRRSPWYTVEGVIQFGSVEIIFARGNSWGIFEWSRAIRPTTDISYWASSCGSKDGRVISFSVGHGLFDSSACTENACFVDGRIHKLDQVAFHISPGNWLSPWNFTSNDNRLEMVFTPQQERIDYRQALFHSAIRRQFFGSFSGKVILDDDSVMDFQNIAGFAEQVKTRF